MKTVFIAAGGKEEHLYLCMDPVSFLKHSIFKTIDLSTLNEECLPRPHVVVWSPS